MARIATTAISQLLLSRTLNFIAPKVGLDVTRVILEEDPNAETLRAEAEIGKYLSSRLYVSYRHVFGAAENENTNEAMMEYRISTRWLLTAYFGDAGNGALNLLWAHSW